MQAERNVQQDWGNHYHRARRMQSRAVSIYARLAWRRARSALGHYASMLRRKRQGAAPRLAPV